MPRMDGYALARRIRAEEAERGLSRTPIVALTASALKGEAERCLGRSEEHTSELQSLMRISYAVFCLKKNNHKHSDNERKQKKQHPITSTTKKQTESTLK